MSRDAQHAASGDRPAFALWGMVLGLGLVAGIVGNVLLAQYVGVMRAQDPKTYLDAAQRLMEQKDVLGAFQQLDEAARIAPQSPEPYKIRGHLLLELKRWNEAFSAYQQAMQRGSRDEDMRLKALHALMQAGRNDEAIAFGKRCIEEGFRYRTFPRYIAEAYSALGKQADSIPYFEEALKGYPNDLYLMERTAQAYRAAGRNDQAEAMQKRIAETQALLDQIER